MRAVRATLYDGLPVRRWSFSTDWKSVVQRCGHAALRTTGATGTLEFSISILLACERIVGVDD
jgi:hypothetical protein